MLSALCVDCHELATDGSRPDFSAKVLEPALAARALRAVLSQEMPPAAAAELGGADRRNLVRFLCVTAGRGDAYCDAAVERDSDPVLVRSGATFLQSVKRVSPAPVPDDLVEQVMVHSRPRATRTLLTPGVVAYSVAVAAAVCNGPQRRSCIERVLALGGAHPKLPQAARSEGAP